MTDEIEDIPPPQVDWYIKVADRAALITALKGPSETQDTFDDDGNRLIGVYSGKVKDQRKATYRLP